MRLAIGFCVTVAFLSLAGGFWDALLISVILFGSVLLLIPVCKWAWRILLTPLW